MLRLENVSWNTPTGVGVISDLSIEIDDGKLTVITGPNGGGKTTLAKLIAGIEKPSSGKIFLDDVEITDMSVTDRAKLGIGFAFQQPVRFKGVTVRKLIELASGGASEKSLCDVLSKVGLCAKEYINREVDSTLSGGEIKRIEIATVLARNSRVSVFDEPEAGIDLWSFSNLIDVFKGIRTDLSGSLIVISHQERILKIADEILVLADGKIKRRGTPTDILGSLLSGREVAFDCRGRRSAE